MPQINAVGVWFGGVLATALPDVCAQVCADAPLTTLDIQVREWLRAKAAELAVGDINTSRFCQQIIDSMDFRGSINDFETAILESIRLRQDVLDVIQMLPPQITRWIICDYPRDWCEAAVMHPLLKVTPIQQMIFTAEIGAAQLTPALFYEWSKRARQPLSRCLLIDASTPRAISALQHGLHATIYVDAKRLQRDFYLRRIVPAPKDFSFPGQALPTIRMM